MNEPATASPGLDTARLDAFVRDAVTGPGRASSVTPYARALCLPQAEGADPEPCHVAFALFRFAVIVERHAHDPAPLTGA